MALQPRPDPVGASGGKRGTDEQGDNDEATNHVMGSATE